MVDESDAMPSEDGRPNWRGDRSTERLLENLVRTMTAMEDGRQPATALDPFATPLAARRIQSIVLAERAERRKRRRRPRTVPAIVRTTSSFHPSAGVTEGVVLVREDQRTRAYCVRLERHGSDWRVVELARPDTALLPVVTRASRTGRIGSGTGDGSGSRRRRRHTAHWDGVAHDPGGASERDRARDDDGDADGPVDGRVPD